MSIKEIIQLISIWGITVPLCIGLLRYKRAEIKFRLFIFFLLLGLATDVSMYLLSQASLLHMLKYILSVYSLAEAMFFFWFVKQHLHHSIYRKIAHYLFLVTPVVWVSLVFFRFYIYNLSPGRYFDPYYEIGVSFLAGFALLKMVETNASVHSPSFWILLAIFFYCFCTFFLMGLLYSQLSHQVWVINNIVNIITYIFYSAGALKLLQRK